jgi:hypothetical protein
MGRDGLMTHDDAVKLKSFKHYCNCGAFAKHSDERSATMHQTWCPQFDEYSEWHKAMYGKEK